MCFTSIIASVFFLAGCDANNTDENSDLGYVQVYNASANAPAIYLTLDEDLDVDDDEDVYQHTYSGIEFTEVSGLLELVKGDYYAELAWQDEDSSARDDLEMIYQQPVEIIKSHIQLFVLAEDIASPNILTYSIELIDDDSDADDDLFNMRVLNLHQGFSSVDVYMSLSDETFNEAQLTSTINYSELSDNQKFEQDQYKVYLTETGSNHVLFESEEIAFPYTSQYVLSIRQNLGADTTPFVIDVLSKSNGAEYQQVSAKASFRVYNAIQVNELLPDYTGKVDLYMNTTSTQPDVENLAVGEFSAPITAEHGDYSFALTLPDTEQQLLKNHLITLSENTAKTVFFYTTEQFVDEDGDGDVDEDGDGQVDEIDITVNSLVVENTQTQGVYEHNINIVNLIDDQDFSSVTVYFVRTDELIENAENKKSVAYSNSNSLNLLNNTYDVFVVARVNSSDVILNSQELVLNETSKAMFLILEADEYSPTGYKMTFSDQAEP